MPTSLKPVDERPGPWSFWWQCQWKEWFRGGFNWKNFTFVNFSLEHGTYKGRYYEWSFGLLGFIGEISWHEPASKSVWLAEMDQIVAECRDHPEELLKLEFRDCEACKGSGTIMVTSRGGKEETL